MRMTKRLFVAVPVSIEIRDRVRQVYAKLEETGTNFSFVNIDNLHFTLKFLGDVEEEKVSEIKCKVAEIVSAQKKFEIKLRGVGVFPSLDQIKVIWVGVEDGELLELLKETNEGLDYIRKDEHEKEVAHLTIARVRSGSERLRDVLDEIKELDFGTMMVDKVILYESELTLQGPIYTEVAVFELS